MVDKELIEIWRNMLKPSISSLLFKINYEGMGEQDKEEFERDLDEILDLALIGLKHKAQLPQERTEKRTESHACDTIYRQAAIDVLNTGFWGVEWDKALATAMLNDLPPAQPETAKRIVGKSRDGMTLWYQCDMCNEPVDAQDHFCRGCGRRLIDE